MGLPDDIAKAATSVGSVISAIELLKPLITPAAQFIEGHDVELPPALGVLKSELELARMKNRVVDADEG